MNIAERRKILGTRTGSGYKPLGMEQPRFVGKSTRAGCLIAKCSKCGKTRCIATDVLAKTGNPGDHCGEMMEVL